MQTYYDEELDTTKARIAELEKELVVQQEALYTAIEQIKETQRFIVKLAHNQSDIVKRISSWPFVAVNIKKDGKDVA